MTKAILVLCALWLGAIPALAQQVTGSITGSVADSSGAAVPGVQVNLSNQDTGLRRLAVSDQDGNFRFLVVPPGNYSVDVSHQGFRGVKRDGIVVEADRSLAVPVVLEVGTVSEVVEVRGGTPLLEPNTSSLGTVMDSRKVEELPLNGRNPLGLANLIPTVRGIGFFGGQVLSSWRLAAVSIGGGPALANGFLVDGIASEKLTVGGTQTFLSIDSTQEFKVLTNAMSAEFGRTAGGIISIVSKGGTNEFHGNLFEFLRNDNLNANDFFSNKAGRTRGALSYNQFGGTIGGPIKRNKLFFFFNYDAFLERRLSQATITSPTLLERSGDFSDTRTANGALIQIFDPTTTRAEGSGFVRTPFAGNRIPTNRIDPVSRNVLTYYPVPNLPGAANTRAQNLFLQGAGPIDRNAVTGKIDYNISDSQRVSGRYTWDDLNWQFARLWGTPAEPDGRAVLIPRNSLSINYNATISPSLLLEARTGFNRENEHFFTPSEGFDITTLGMPEAFKRQTYVGKGADTGRFPYIDLRADASLFGAIASRGGPSNTIVNSVAITKIKGSHTIKTGYERRFYAANDYGREYSVGNYTFNRGFTQGPNPLQANANAGFTVASFLLGTPASAYARLQTDGTASVKYNALFVQDDWKVTRRLTLNLGLRWEHEAPPTDRYNVLTNFDPNIESPLKVPGLALRGGLTFPGVGGASRSLTESSYKNFGPRFGFAYQANSKTVVRGGFGIMYIPITVSLQRTGYTLDTPFVASLDGGLTPQDRLSNPFPSGLTPPTGSSLGALTNVGAAAAGQLRDVKRGYTEQWNFTVQHEPWNNWLFEAAWVGNHGVRLFGDGRNLNFLSDANFARGAELAQNVTNPFRGIITTGPLSGATITRSQSLMPFPQFTAATGGYSFLNNSIYHALAVKVEKRFSAGFSVLVAYTASKLLDDGTNSTQVRPGAAFVTVPQNWNNLRAERSKSPQDVPQRMVVSALWALPFGKTGHALTRHIAGGWQLNAIQTIESGTPISLSATVTGGGNRPNVVPGVAAKLDNPTIDRWFDTNAFSNPAGYTFGNVSRTLPDIHSDSLYNLDLSLFKNFHFGEKMSLQFRAEAFNATNSPTFDTPGRVLNSATFGVVTATAFNPKPREIQLALRFLF
ncbi:MAG TPA: carboxypeptidase regulatory-like domain-containing protein [Bryobacteraceae bacterium]|nr:carboxypeptidase regulatory-like domain-containing protein [Bryobacteraceae bacterium]